MVKNNISIKNKLSLTLDFYRFHTGILLLIGDILLSNGIIIVGRLFHLVFGYFQSLLSLHMVFDHFLTELLALSGILLKKQVLALKGFDFTAQILDGKFQMVSVVIVMKGQLF